MKSMRWCPGVIPVFVLAVASMPGGAMAQAGAVKGRVLFKGEAPAPETMKVTVNAETCSNEHVSEKLVVGEGGGLQWAVVSIAGVAPPATQEATIDQKGCRFVPHVVVVPVGKKLNVLNSDGILHNVHTFSAVNRSVNRAQPGFTKKMDLAFEKPETFRVGCDVHPWMASWVIVSENLAVVTDAKGNFELTGLAPGTYDVKVWHEALGEQSQKITVKAGGSAEANFTMAAK